MPDPRSDYRLPQTFSVPRGIPRPAIGSSGGWGYNARPAGTPLTTGGPIPYNSRTPEDFLSGLPTDGPSTTA